MQQGAVKSNQTISSMRAGVKFHPGIVHLLCTQECVDTHMLPCEFNIIYTEKWFQTQKHNDCIVVATLQRI